MDYQTIEQILIERGENTLLQAVKEFKDIQKTMNKLANDARTDLLPTNMVNSNRSARKVVEILTKRCCKLFNVCGQKMHGMLSALKELSFIPNKFITSIKEIHRIGNIDSHQVGLDNQIIISNYYFVNKELEYILVWYVNYAHQFKKQSYQVKNNRSFVTNNSCVYDRNANNAYSIHRQNNLYAFIIASIRRNREREMMKGLILWY